MKKRIVTTTTPILLFALLQFPAEAQNVIITYADGRVDGGIRQAADLEDESDSPGDIFVFDQKLLADDAEMEIGRNAGYCIRTDPGAPDFSSTDHPTLPDDPYNNYWQCSWTLSFSEHSGYTGSITVSGREAEFGTSRVPIVGGTGEFIGATGVLISTPIPQGEQGEEGVLYLQELNVFFARHTTDYRRYRWREHSAD